jgi:hypothetical protein
MGHRTNRIYSMLDMSTTRYDYLNSKDFVVEQEGMISQEVSDGYEWLLTEFDG